jgi:hypothetical protein
MKFSILISSLSIALALVACSDDVKEATVAEAKIEVSILKWGPQQTKVGTSFFPQPNGNSALWFEQRGIHNAESVSVILCILQVNDLIKEILYNKIKR